MKKIFGRSRAPLRTPLGSSTVLPRPPSCWDLLPLPKNSTPLSAFGLDFWRLGPHWVASPQSPHFPQCVRVLIKILLVPIFGAKECIRMQDFVLKYTKNNSGGPDPRNPAPGGEKFVRTHPHAHCPPAECWCPSTSSRLATALPHPVPTRQMLWPLRFF